MDRKIPSSVEGNLRKLAFAPIAPYLFVALWSTGFIGAKYGLPYADPFIFLAVRILIAAVILFIVALFVTLMGSTTATLMQKKIGSNIPLISGTAYQYLFSGAVLGLIALTTKQTSIDWNLKFIFAFIWLIGVLSVGANSLI